MRAAVFVALYLVAAAWPLTDGLPPALYGLLALLVGTLCLAVAAFWLFPARAT